VDWFREQIVYRKCTNISVNENLFEQIIDLTGYGLAAGETISDMSPLTVLLPLIVALVVSMVIIPFMVRIAPMLGMIDAPDPRKIHAAPIPRVGGAGIVFGTLLPIIILLPLDHTLLAFVIGAVVLYMFGALDDSHELGHYVKFIGQFIATITVVYFGDVYINQFPFLNDAAVSAEFGKPLTVFAMVGMINAMNHSDGLDGLAGGESLLSLGCIAWLAWLAGGENIIIMSLATIGGLFGFMRYNTYPASIFMGDGGSQFLGYTLGFLAVLLTQQVNPVISPALPLLILGLPIADILVVFVKRIYSKMNWFRATRNHIHHRLLDLGFQHYESVVIVYSVQALLVLCAVLMPYESDALVVVVYLAITLSVFMLLYIAEYAGWQVRKEDAAAYLDNVIESATSSTILMAAPYAVVYFGMSVFLVVGTISATDIPPDLTIVASILFILLLIRLVGGYRLGFLSLRLLMYVTIVFSVYLLSTYQPEYLMGADPLTYAFFGVLVMCIAMAIRFPGKNNFDVTPTDYLIVLVVLVLTVFASSGIVNTGMIAIALKSIILFYGCELIISRMQSRWNIFTLAMLTSLLLTFVRGFMINL
jgi:UDP-GlcNAc:undecaprenyl-phosphate GlcNAc-1-phosphate transferase